LLSQLDEFLPKMAKENGLHLRAVRERD